MGSFAVTMNLCALFSRLVHTLPRQRSALAGLLRPSAQFSTGQTAKFVAMAAEKHTEDVPLVSAEMDASLPSVSPGKSGGRKRGVKRAATAPSQASEDASGVPDVTVAAAASAKPKAKKPRKKSTYEPDGSIVDDVAEGSFELQRRKFLAMTICIHAGVSQASVELAVAACAVPAVDADDLKIISWNVDGWRSKANTTQKLADIKTVLAAENADVLCFQEHKLQQEHVPAMQAILEELGYEHSWFAVSTARKGYSGVALATKAACKPISVQEGIGECDDEGRVLTAEFPGCFVITSYVPNSGRGLDRLSYRTEKWDSAMRAHIHKLQLQKPVMWTGDLNVANLDLDLFDPAKKADKSPGFTYAERNSFKNTLQECSLVDVWREANPTLRQYSYWGFLGAQRSKNNGWRLDYTLVSEVLRPAVVGSFIRAHVPYSDHVPVGIVLKGVKGGQ